jgi:hypothetical protein
MEHIHDTKLKCDQLKTSNVTANLTIIIRFIFQTFLILTEEYKLRMSEKSVQRRMFKRKMRE